MRPAPRRSGPTTATPPAPGPEPARRAPALSAQKSRLLVRVYRDPDTMGAGLSHDHVILARSLSGSVTWHPTDPTACDIQVRLPVRQLNPDPPRLRARLGLEGTLSEKQRGQVKKHMLADDQLHGDAHSHITFTATSCAATEGAVVVNGKLTIRGETRSVQTILQVDLSDGFHAAGTPPSAPRSSIRALHGADGRAEEPGRDDPGHSSVGQWSPPRVPSV